MTTPTPKGKKKRPLAIEAPSTDVSAKKRQCRSFQKTPPPTKTRTNKSTLGWYFGNRTHHGPTTVPRPRMEASKPSTARDEHRKPQDSTGSFSNNRNRFNFFNNTTKKTRNGLRPRGFACTNNERPRDASAAHTTKSSAKHAGLSGSFPAPASAVPPFACSPRKCGTTLPNEIPVQHQEPLHNNKMNTDNKTETASSNVGAGSSSSRFHFNEDDETLVEEDLEEEHEDAFNNSNDHNNYTLEEIVGCEHEKDDWDGTTWCHAQDHLDETVANASSQNESARPTLEFSLGIWQGRLAGCVVAFLVFLSVWLPPSQLLLNNASFYFVLAQILLWFLGTFLVRWGSHLSTCAVFLVGLLYAHLQSGEHSSLVDAIVAVLLLWSRFIINIFFVVWFRVGFRTAVVGTLVTIAWLGSPRVRQLVIALWGPYDSKNSTD